MYLLTNLIKYMKKYLILLLLAGALIVSACGTEKKNDDVKNVSPESKPAAGVYSIDTATSQVNWHAEKFIGKSHNGSVKIKSGSVSISPESSTGSIIIDMTSISESENTEALIKHLKSPDFFDVAKFPESKIELTKITPTDDTNKYEISGNLTIKDKTNPISFNAIAIGAGDNIKLTGKFSIDRTLWNVRFGSNKFFDNLGDQAIRDDIDYDISISANKLTK